MANCSYEKIHFVLENIICFVHVGQKKVPCTSLLNYIPILWRIATERVETTLLPDVHALSIQWNFGFA